MVKEQMKWGYMGWEESLDSDSDRMDTCQGKWRKVFRNDGSKEGWKGKLGLGTARGHGKKNQPSS
jgi:hypothetical protein